jgi:hypothetical protein
MAAVRPQKAMRAAWRGRGLLVLGLACSGAGAASAQG